MSINLENEVLEDDEIEEALEDLDDWLRDGAAIKKTFTFGSFLEAIAFVNRVAVVAEKMNHHPDFDINFKRVVLRCWTHKHNALTKADTELAKEIETVA